MKTTRQTRQKAALSVEWAIEDADKALAEAKARHAAARKLNRSTIKGN